MKSVTTTATCLLVLALVQVTMSATVSTDPASFFLEIQGNLTKISWAHAVNSKVELDNALKSADVMMLEADVVLGRLNGTNGTEIPIMAHPPANESTLSLDEFLTTVLDNKTKKGIKLDFKSTEAFNASKPILDKFRNDLKIPVFLNADIIPGPVNATTKPVDAATFLAQGKTYPDWTLSAGWTTRYGSKDNVVEGRYTGDQIQKMIDAMKKQQVTQPITYPVRAGLAAQDSEAIKTLMQKSSDMRNVTLTVWSSEGDKVDAEKLSTLIKDIGVTKVFVDVPQDLMKSLRLSGASNVGVASIATILLAGVFLSAIL